MPYPQQNKAFFQDFGECPAFKFIWHINTSYLYIYWSTGRNIDMQACCAERHHFCRAAFPSEGCNSATWRAPADAAQPASLLHVVGGTWLDRARTRLAQGTSHKIFSLLWFFFFNVNSGLVNRAGFGSSQDRSPLSGQAEPMVRSCRLMPVAQPDQ